MNLARSHRPSRRGSSRRAQAFTLLEILVTIAIIGLLATVLIGGSAALLRSRTATAEDVFDKVVQECRKTALKEEKEIRLVCRKGADGTRKFFIIDSEAPAMDPLTEAASDTPTGVLQEFPLPAKDDVDVTFLSTQKGGNLTLVGGMVVETQPMPFVRFYADGTCSPFRTQFVKAGAQPHIIAIDPWTCAAVLPAIDPNAVTP